MASGQTLFILDAKSSQATATSFATQGTIVDASTPLAIFSYLKFPAAANSHRDWFLQVPSNYAGGGFTFSWKGGTDNTNTGVFELEFRVIKVADASIMTSDLGVDTATAVTITDTPPATPINKINYSTTGNLSHANAGSPSAGDFIIVRATRDVSVGSNNTGALQLVSIIITET